MPDDIAACQVAEADIVQTGQHLHSNVQTGLCSRSKVFLRSVAGDDNLGTEADSVQEHLHLGRRRILRFVEDDISVVEGTSCLLYTSDAADE